MSVSFWHVFPLCVHGMLCIRGFSRLPAHGGSFGISALLENPPLLPVDAQCTMRAPTALLLSRFCLGNANSMGSPGDKDEEETEE